VAEALREVTEPRRFTVTVYGTLQIADAIQHGFGLRLDPKGDRPPELRGRRVIRGTYTPRAGDLIRDRGLWGKSVRAQLRIERDALVSTSAIRPPVFTLLDVEERAG
jgi:hypothetical protein